MEHRIAYGEVHRASEDSEEEKINIAYVQKIIWVGTKAQDVDKFKLWYSRGLRDRNGVGI